MALELARVLQSQGKHKAIVRLFHNLHKTKADDPYLPAAYLMVAKIFHEFLNEDLKAKMLVEFVLKKYPNTAQREQFLQLQAALQKSGLPI
jgi:TolA-binding protein